MTDNEALGDVVIPWSNIALVNCGGGNCVDRHHGLPGVNVKMERPSGREARRARECGRGGGRRVRQAAPGGEAVRARLGGACVAVAQRHRYAFVPGTRWLRQQHPHPHPHVRRQTRRRRRCRGLTAPVRPPRPSPSPAPVRSPASTAAGLSVQDPGPCRPRPRKEAAALRASSPVRNRRHRHRASSRTHNRRDTLYRTVHWSPSIPSPRGASASYLQSALSTKLCGDLTSFFAALAPLLGLRRLEGGRVNRAAVQNSQHHDL